MESYMGSYIVTWQYVNLIFSSCDNPPDLVASNISSTTSSRRRGPHGLSESHPLSADAHTQRLKCQKIEGGYGTTSVAPRLIGAADRIRTGDVQLGKLAFCH